MIAREIARNIARTNMKDAGFVRFNRKQNVRGTDSDKKRSFFAIHWREWVRRTK